MDMKDAIVTLADVAVVRAKLEAGISEKLMADIIEVTGAASLEKFKEGVIPSIMQKLDQVITDVETELQGGKVLTHGEFEERMYVAELEVVSSRLSEFASIIAEGKMQGDLEDDTYRFNNPKLSFTALAASFGDKAALGRSAAMQFDMPDFYANDIHPAAKVGIGFMLKTAFICAA